MRTHQCHTRRVRGSHAVDLYTGLPILGARPLDGRPAVGGAPKDADNAVVDASTDLDSFRGRVLGLGAGRAAIVALACAQRLADTTHTCDPMLTAALAAGWSRTASAEELRSHADDLEGRPDADDDVIAAAAYALRGLDGSLEHAWWSVSRLIDSSFGQAEYDADSTAFRALGEDALQPGVRLELDWLEATLQVATKKTDPTEFADRLRSR